MADLSRDTLLFAKVRRRMCKDCTKECPLWNNEHCNIGSNLGSEEISAENDRIILKAVQNFYNSMQGKTYLQDFMERFPFSTPENGIPICINRIYGTEFKCDNRTCKNCWNEKMP